MKIKGFRSYACAFKKDSSDVCNHQFYEKHQFVYHLINNHLEENSRDIFTCEICGKGYLDMKRLELHRKRDHSDGEPEHLCPHCGKGFWEQSRLSYHIDAKHTIPTLLCDFCPRSTEKAKRLFTTTSLKYHKESVHEKKAMCSRCSYRVDSNDKLVDHFRDKHLNYKQFVCKTCGTQFARMYNARQHFQQVHQKNMNRKLDFEFFEKNKDVIENRKQTDVNFPSNQEIATMIKRELASANSTDTH